MKRIYLDYNATAPLRLQVKEVMDEVMTEPSNPSSMHTYGRAAKKRLEDARKTIADAISAFPDEIIFTASGTEANNTALKGIVKSKSFISAIEHSSIISTAEDSTFLPVDDNGVIHLHKLADTLAAYEGTQRVIVSVMLANNETGVVQAIEEVAKITKQRGALLHVDAVQALGKIPVNFTMLGADMMSISAHKLGGPLGAAALVIRHDLPIRPLISGGGQELRRRAGTENVAAIAGFAKSVEIASADSLKSLRGWLDAMEQELSAFAPAAKIFGQKSPRLPNTSNISMPGMANETQLIAFDLAGIAVSAGSACSSGRIEPSHVLMAMGASEQEASSAIRISGGWNTKESDIQAFTQAWKNTYSKAKAA